MVSIRASMSVCLLVLASAPCRAAPDVIFRGGPILTMDNPARVDALAVTGARISAVGSTAAIMKDRGPGTRIVDLGGKTLMPGFIDAHGHFPIGGLFARIAEPLESPPVGTLRDMTELISRLKSRAARTPPGQWVQGTSYDDTLLPERRHPTRADLDRASTQHPIYIIHVSGHVAVANSMALKLAGIGAGATPPAGGKYRVDPATGEPNGVLEESAMASVAALLPKPGPEDFRAAIAADGELYLSKGVTTAQDGAATLEDIAALTAAVHDNRLPLRVDVWPMAPLRLAAPSAVPSAPDGQDLLRLTASKAFADGSIQALTGYLGRPYYTRDGHDDDYRGYPRAARETLAAQVLRLHQAGYQLAIHANGDAAIDDVLFAYAKAQEAAPRPDARPIVVHAQMARDDQLDTMKRLGVIPSFFNLHVYYWGDRHRDIFIGPDRASRISPMRAAIDKGLTITLHSDTPVVPLSPLMNVWSAVTRRTSSGAVLGADQRITAEEALRAVTINAAYQGHAEADKGSIAVGKLADFVVLAENPVTIDPQRIKDIQTEQTYVGGVLAWSRDGSRRR